MADISQGSDPRVGSARDNATTTVVAGVSTGQNSSSAIALLVTLVPVTVYALICFLIFLVMRRKIRPVYSPRTLLGILDPHERSPELPSGWLNWIKPFTRIPDTFVLNHSSLDGFLFLRYIKVLCIICFVGCCITWPVLMPLHAYGGNGHDQLDSLTYGNVSNANWHWVHAFLAWIFFGFILYMVSRECIYYINLRQAYLFSPFYANRLSSRTVLFSCIPQDILDEAKLRKIFGDKVRNVWIPKDTEELDQLVKERDQTALRLEKAEIALIKKANAARKIAIKNGHADIEANIGTGPDEQPREPDARLTPESPQPPTDSQPDAAPDVTPTFGYGLNGPPPDINGSVASQWIPHSSRPSHRPLANYGRRVDTIKWTRMRLKTLAPKISKLRRQNRSGKGTPMPAAFIEFVSQVDAQSAYQTLSHHRPLHMSPRLIGVRPRDIVWSSLRLKWWERIIRKFSIQGFIVAMVIFWSIPCAIIGIISNIDFLTSKVSFLSWIDRLPSVILGLLKGLIPAAALSFLMAIVPGILRSCARVAGVPSLPEIELFVQSAYMVFQVVQVFLVTTLTSAASAAFSQILENPMSARDLLSENLPKASNFYVSYFILQGLAASATSIVHVPRLIRYQMLQAAESPRIATRWKRLRVIHWGGVFPVFTNMGVIAISYSCIAPVTLGFAGIGLYFIYLAYRYNLIYVFDSEIDTKGLVYPHALKQTLVGVYLAEICMIGLFGIDGSFGPVFVMILCIVFTAMVHVSLNDALGPLLYNLPKTLAFEEQYRQLPNGGVQVEDNTGMLCQEKWADESESEYPASFDPGEESTRAIEGASSAMSFATKTAKTIIESKVKSKVAISGFIDQIDFWTRWISPDPNIKPNFLLNWLHPEVFADYTILRQMIPPDLPEPVYPGDSAREAYFPPSVVMPTPKLWIPRDPGGVSRQEVAHTGKVTSITDEGADLDEKNRVVIDWEAVSPIALERIRY